MAGKQKFDPSLVLKDKKNFPDDVEITLPGGAVMSLGELRQYDEATSGSLQAEMEKERKQINAERVRLQAETDRVAQVYVQTQQEKAAIEAAKAELKRQNPRATKSDIEELLEADPVYQAMSKKHDELMAKITNLESAFTEKTKAITGTMNEVGQTYLNERYEREFDEIMAKDDKARPKDLDLPSLYKFAVDNGIKKRNGIIDIPKAYNQMTQQQRHKLEVDAAYERGQKEATKAKAQEAIMPRPGFGLEIPGLDQVVQGKVAPKNLNEAFAAAAHDPSMFTNVGEA